jgi:hypothetical protein
MAGRVMTMPLDAFRATILEARRDPSVTPPFPSGVAPTDNRIGFLNASEAGRCTRALWYAKHGIAGETHLPLGMLDRGHSFEHWLNVYATAALKRIGGDLLYSGANQMRLMLSESRLAATPDGLIKWKDGSETVFEAKSHDEGYNYDAGPSEMHVRQVEMIIELFHETTGHRPEDGFIIYGLTSNYERLTLHRVERRPAVFMEMLGKAAAAFDSDTALAVTAEGVITKQCVICPYRTRCAAAQAAGIPKAGTGGLDETTLRTLDRLVAARARAVEAEEEAASARAELEAEIIAVLADAGGKKIKRNGYAVRLKPQKDGPAVIEIRSA